MLNRRTFLKWPVALLGLMAGARAAAAPPATFVEQYGKLFAAGMDNAATMPRHCRGLLDVLIENVAIEVDGVILSREYVWLPSRINDPMSPAYAGVKAMVERPIRYYRAPNLDGWVPSEQLPRGVKRLEYMDHRQPGGKLVRYAREIV